ncbi:MAG: hypothetical protein KAS21_08565 [Candidatus Aminicenantes bacterium]|nr:hypothetical protein [Candidatus Aminicenantes bacterium]
MKYFSLLIIVSSLFFSCRGRIFNNPNDPEKDERGYEILSIISIENGRVPFDLTFTGDSLWIIQERSHPVSLNYTSGSIIRELYTQPASGIAYDNTNLWIIENETRSLVNISIINGEEIRTIRLPEGDYNYLEFREPYLYTIDKLTNSITIIDPDSGSIITSFRSPSFSIDGFCFDGTSFWILDGSETKIFVTDTEGLLTNTFRTPTDTPSGLASSGNVIWMGDQSGKILKLRFD